MRHGYITHIHASKLFHCYKNNNFYNINLISSL
jgi:hypothetical protein